MKTGIPKFLPDRKKEELKRIVELIELDFPNVNMVILYGSYARGTWVEDMYQDQRGTTYEYLSDYDLLVVTSDEKKAKKGNFQHKLEDKIDALGFKTPVGLIYHGYPYIKYMLKEKRYFFCDIYYEGYVLSNLRNREFEEPSKISNELRFEKSKEYFEDWFGSASVFFETYYIHYNNAEKGDLYLKNAAFQLHQATERFFNAICLIYTDYAPKTHNLFKLYRMVRSHDIRFKEVFPQVTKEDKRLFKLLKDAYIDSRYRSNYKITKEELEYLASRVEILKELTKQICEEKIEYFSTLADK